MRLLLFCITFVVLLLLPGSLLGQVHAQNFRNGSFVGQQVSPTASPSATPSPTPKKDITKPETNDDHMFDNRRADHLNITNAIAYGVQYAVKSGVPANTIMLILLLPFLATLVVFFRYIIGLQSLGLLVPIALSITFLSTGILAGLILLATIFLASFIARIILKRIRIMQLPKLALSMWLVAVAIVTVLTLCAAGGILTVKEISIFPILLLVLLSDRVVAIFLERSLKEVSSIATVTLLLGILGFFLLSWTALRDFVILYPEIVLLCVPINIIMGRYFGLRMTEYVRFKPIRDYERH